MAKKLAAIAAIADEMIQKFAMTANHKAEKRKRVGPERTHVDSHDKANPLRSRTSKKMRLRPARTSHKNLQTSGGNGQREISLRTAQAHAANAELKRGTFQHEDVAQHTKLQLAECLVFTTLSHNIQTLGSDRRKTGPRHRSSSQTWRGHDLRPVQKEGLPRQCETGCQSATSHREGCHGRARFRS